jgi:hypothetical protein
VDVAFVVGHLLYAAKTQHQRHEGSGCRLMSARQRRLGYPTYSPRLPIVVLFSQKRPLCCFANASSGSPGAAGF